MSFQCNTCQMTFHGLTEMKMHYESDLHTENVKRRVNGLVPLTAQAHGTRSRVATSVQSTSYKCTVCDKRFATPQTLKSHLQSKAHKERKAARKHLDASKDLAAPAEEAEAEEAAAAAAAAAGGADEADVRSAEALLEAEEEWEAGAERVPLTERLAATDCLFCSLRAPTPEDALCHMAKRHNFTLPLADKIVDVPGLLGYLALKLNGGLCFVCDEDKMFDTRRGVQDHMVSCGHTMIRIDDGEYSEFYDRSLPARWEAPEDREGLEIKLANGGRVLSKNEFKEHQIPMSTGGGAAGGEASQPKLLTEEGRKKAHLTVAQMGRYQELLQAREKIETKKEQRMEKNHTRYVNKQRMRLGVHLNNQHGKGYQGDYVGKTI